MKRSIALYAGILGLSPFFASAALGNVCFSTGPLENEVLNRSVVALVKVLNNSPAGNVTASVLVFALNGSKDPIFSDSFVVGPRSSDFVVPTVGETDQFEIQVKLNGPSRNKTLLGVFGEDSAGNLNPSHRLVHTELVKISCDLFGPVPPNGPPE